MVTVSAKLRVEASCWKVMILVTRGIEILRALVIRGRLPVIGLPNADFLRHGPPLAYARGRGAVGGAEPWPQVHPGVVRGARAAAGL